MFYFIAVLISSVLFVILINKYFDALQKHYIALKNFCFSKICWINLWHRLLIFIRWKKKLSFPYEIKKYIAANAFIDLQIDLFQCSKQFQQLIKKHRGKQCGKLELLHDNRTLLYLVTDNVDISMQPTNKFLTAANPLKVQKLYMTNILRNNDEVKEFYAKLDLNELEDIILNNVRLDATVFKKYIVPSLVIVDLCNVFVENVDVPLFVLEQCPLVTTIFVSWDHHLTTMSKLAAVKRKTKLKKCYISGITIVLQLNDVINFINNQMCPLNDSSIHLHNTSNFMVNPEYDLCYTWEETDTLLTQQFPHQNFYIFCKISK